MFKPELSDRQLRIGEYVAAGFANRDIAKELGVTEQVVKNVVHSLFDRLGVWNRVELANYFSRSGVVDERAERRMECERLAELRRFDILDTAAERVYDELTSLAARIFEVPIALLAFVDSTRVWFKSNVGLTTADVPRELTICQHTIRQSDVYVVNDAGSDSRFACNPLIQAVNLRFYAAAPLLTEEGYALGVLCIVDCKPRQFSIADQEILRSLSRVALEQVSLRRQLRHLQSAEARIETVRMKGKATLADQ